jgi:hypothetical protein
VEAVHKIVVDGITNVLDREITVKAGSNVYLAADTLRLMAMRDSGQSGSPKDTGLD